MFRRARSTAIEVLFTEQFDPIYRFAACRVGRDAALDIAAETFAQALRSADRMDRTRDARPWLFGIASNLIRRHRRAYAAAGLQSEGPPGRNGHPESEILLRARLVDALVRLDARDREALLLLAWADLTYEEIATAFPDGGGPPPVATSSQRTSVDRPSISPGPWPSRPGSRS